MFSMSLATGSPSLVYGWRWTDTFWANLAKIAQNQLQSTGPDNIQPKLLKLAGYAIVPPLVDLYRYSINSGTVLRVVQCSTVGKWQGWPLFSKGTTKLSWAPHTQELKKSFAKKLNLLKRSRFLPRDILLSLYFKVILPSVGYGLVMWGVGCNICFPRERLHCRAARIIFNLYNIYLYFLASWINYVCMYQWICWTP